jgi:hypothetical protein
MFDTYVFGEDFWGGAVDGDLAVSGVRTDGGVEAVHVDEAVHVEVVAQREVARPRQVHHAEVAARLDVVVHAVGDDGVVPGVLDHARLVRVVVHERVPHHEALEVDVILPVPRLVPVEDLLRQLRDVVPWQSLQRRKTE